MKYAPGYFPKNPLPAAPAGPRVAIPIAQQTLNPGKKPYVDPTPNAIPRGAIPRPTMPSMPQRTPVGTPNAIPKGAMGRMAKGGKVSSASKRADGCAVRGKTKGQMI